jgi:hypothetical protein
MNRQHGNLFSKRNITAPSCVIPVDAPSYAAVSSDLQSFNIVGMVKTGRENVPRRPLTEGIPCGKCYEALD